MIFYRYLNLKAWIRVYCLHKYLIFRFIILWSDWICKFRAQKCCWFQSLWNEGSSSSTPASTMNGSIQFSENAARDESMAMLASTVGVGGANTGFDDTNHTVVLHPIQYENEKGCCGFCWRIGNLSGFNRHKSVVNKCLVVTLATSLIALICFILVVFLNPSLFFKLNSKWFFSFLYYFQKQNHVL